MSLVNLHKASFGFTFSLIVVFLLTAFLLTGCGGSEQATTEQQVQQESAAGQPAAAVQPAGTPQPAQAAEQAQPKAQEKPKEEVPMDNALTNFLGKDEQKVDSTSAKQPVVVAQTEPSQLAQYEKQISDLRTENTSVKQRNVKLEEDNRLLTSRLNDTEAKLAAEKDRADKAEATAKAAPAAPKVEETSSASVTPSSYDDALKAFQARKYDAALKGFQAVASSGAGEDIVGNATYWTGETHYALKNYKVALEDFQGVLKMKSSLKKGDAQFMLGQTYEKLGQKTKAKAAYEKVVKDYPLNKNVKRAKQRWAKL
ncbi:MAG TPA: tetratricopeptide repeat protein [Bacteroidota bacterium]|nr:tetratricopeptide repeat protein [Bacteroidota bacterium]